MSRNIGVILAGGSGMRVGADVPKQFLMFAGKTVLEHSVEVFESYPRIDEIAIVVREDYIPDVEAFVEKNQWKKVKHILKGGKERYDSSLAAVAIYEDDDNLLLHDAVRPLLTHRILDDCIESLKYYNAIDVGVMMRDTIIQVNADRCIDYVPPRHLLRSGQTPQCFKRKTLRQAYEIALRDPAFVTTDDCGTVVRYLPNEKVYVVEGDVSNMKLTFKEDLPIIEKMYWERMKSE